MTRADALRLAFIALFECQPSYVAKDIGAVARIADQLQAAHERGRREVMSDQVSTAMRELGKR